MLAVLIDQQISNTNLICQVVCFYAKKYFQQIRIELPGAISYSNEKLACRIIISKRLKMHKEI